MKKTAYQDMTFAVNAVSTSGPRTVQQVTKKLSDFKSDTKKKGSQVKTYSGGTGGGSPIKITLSPSEELLLSATNPQLIDGIINDGDTSMIIDISEDSPQSPPPTSPTPLNQRKSSFTTDVTDSEVSNFTFRSQTPTSDLKFKKNFGFKRARFSEVNSETGTSKAEELLEVERKKVTLMEELLAIKRIKLSAKLKKYESLGIDCNQELKDLTNLHSI